MKIEAFLSAMSLLLISPQFSQAAEKQIQPDVLAQRGEGIVSQSSFEAQADRIPKDQRHRTLRDRDRLQDIINTLLINAQLSAEARAAGFDTERIVVDRMKLAAETELARAWLDYYVASQPAGNYEQLAREYYELNQDKLLSPQKIDVSHILVSRKEHTPEEAKELADSLSDQLKEQPSLFDQFITQYSEDPSAATNKGMYKSVKRGQMEKPFEEVAFALQENEISSPVRTIHGYHIIRLDARIAATKKTFEEVRPGLMERERKAHEERIKRDYLASLTSLDVSMTKEALDEMFRRQFGENFSESPDSSPETE